MICLDDLDTKEITSMKELLQAFGVPTYDIISTGFNNKYIHPFTQWFIGTKLKLTKILTW